MMGTEKGFGRSSIAANQPRNAKKSATGMLKVKKNNNKRRSVSHQVVRKCNLKVAHLILQ